MTLNPNDPFLEGAIRQMIRDETDRLGVLIRQLQGMVGPDGELSIQALTVSGAVVLNSGLTALGGQVTNVSYLRLPEVPDPAPVANTAFLYARDNGAGKTELAAQVGLDPSPYVIRTEP